MSRTHGILLLLGAGVASLLIATNVWGLLRAHLLVGLLGGVLGAVLAVTCWVVAVAARSPAHSAPSVSWLVRGFVLAAFPAALLGSAFDCGGFLGCTLVCRALSAGWLPLLLVLVLVAWIRPAPLVLLLVTLLSFVLLVPNCICYNLVNQPWIDWLGFSPACFSASFAVGVAVLGAVAARRHLALAGVVGWVTAIALLTFAVTHHRFGWPW